MLRNSGDPRSVDLGDADAIDRLVAQLRHALADPRRDSIKAASRALDAQVMAPVRVLLGEARHVQLAPDAALHLVPFGALLDEQGRYLIERCTFTYLTTGRDLLRMATRQPARQPPLIVADPEFGTRPGPEAQAYSPNATPRLVDFRHVQFESLPGTAHRSVSDRRRGCAAQPLAWPAPSR